MPLGCLSLMCTLLTCVIFVVFDSDYRFSVFDENHIFADNYFSNNSYFSIYISDTPKIIGIVEINT